MYDPQSRIPMKVKETSTDSTNDLEVFSSVQKFLQHSILKNCVIRNMRKKMC